MSGVVKKRLVLLQEPTVVILCCQTGKRTTMGKMTTFSGQPQYLQILNPANRAKIQEICKQNKYDRYVKKLDGYTHFVALLFAVLMRYDSLRKTVSVWWQRRWNSDTSTSIIWCGAARLSEANNHRSSSFSAEIYRSLYKQYSDVFADSRSEEWVIAIYDRRWQIETLFKQLKQNFPLKYFYGDIVNAIESQIWITMIAINLLLTVIHKRLKRK